MMESLWVAVQGRDDFVRKLDSLMSENSDMYEDIGDYMCRAQLEPALARLPRNQRIAIEGTYGLNGGNCLTSREVGHCWPFLHRTPFRCLPLMPHPRVVPSRQTSRRLGIGSRLLTFPQKTRIHVQLRTPQSFATYVLGYAEGV